MGANPTIYVGLDVVGYGLGAQDQDVELKGRLNPKP